MTGTFAGLGVISSGLRAAQTGLDIAGNNIANVNTPGYSRQRAVFAQGDSTNLPGVNVMRTYSGVVVESIERIRDLFADKSFRQQANNLGYNQIIAEMTVAANEVLGEPSETGLVAKLTDFFEATKDFATTPESSTSRSIFINAAVALTDAFNQIDDSLGQLQRDVDLDENGRLSGAVAEVNSLLEQLAETHAQVLKSVANGVPSHQAADKRDELLDRLSTLYNFTIERESDGSFRKLTTTLYDSEAKVTASNAFPNVDDAIAGITVASNTLILSVNNGAGISTGPFTVNFEAGSTMRDVVTKINNTFKAAGGFGKIASVSDEGELVLSTSLIDDAVNSASAEIDITGGSALIALGLTAATTNGSAGEEVDIVDQQGAAYVFDVEAGNTILGSNPSTLILRTNDGLLTREGSLDQITGEVGGFLQVANVEIPEMREMLDELAMSIKTSVNDLLTLGTTTFGSAGAELFNGNTAGSIGVITNIVNNPDLISAGKTANQSDGAIASEIADLFFGNDNIVSDNAKSQMLYIDSPSASSVQSLLPLIPGGQVTIYADGIITDGSSDVNAGKNGFGGGSLVQFEFLDATGTLIGSVNNFSSNTGAPEERVSYTGTIPASAAFVRFSMNGSSFNDNDLTDNEGHFRISVIQGGINDSASNFNNKITDIVGDFGTRANIGISKFENTQALHDSINNRRLATSGVSLEEDSAELIRFQTAFAANANVMRVYNEVLESILAVV